MKKAPENVSHLPFSLNSSLLFTLIL